MTVHGEVSVSHVDTEAGRTSLVTTTHANGGVSEVVVYLDGDGLNVVVSASATNGYIVVVDDADVARRAAPGGGV